jgi:hypothetical protein
MMIIISRCLRPYGHVISWYINIKNHMTMPFAWEIHISCFYDHIIDWDMNIIAIIINYDHAFVLHINMHYTMDKA